MAAFTASRIPTVADVANAIPFAARILSMNVGLITEQPSAVNRGGSEIVDWKSESGSVIPVQTGIQAF